MSKAHNETVRNTTTTKGLTMSSGLADFIRKNGGDRGNHQFRLIAEVKGVEFSSPVYQYLTMLQVLDTRGIEYGDLKKILARPAGQLEWKVL